MKVLSAIAALTVCSSAAAQGPPGHGRDAPLEPTMTLIAANAESPAFVTASIELPPDASSGGDVPRGQNPEQPRGNDTSNLAREDGRAFGEAAAAAARDNRESASRAAHRVDAPGRPTPETPDRPTPPPR